MTDRFRVYVRGEDGKFEHIESGGWCSCPISGSMGKLKEISFRLHKNSWPLYIIIKDPNERYGTEVKAVMFRDLDLGKPIKEDCVVCEMVTDELCDGSLCRDGDGVLGRVQYIDPEGDLKGTLLGLWSFSREDHTRPIIFSFDDAASLLDTPELGHHLTHIFENGEVKER